jgi:hypothetical protein
MNETPSWKVKVRGTIRAKPTNDLPHISGRDPQVVTFNGTKFLEFAMGPTGERVQGNRYALEEVIGFVLEPSNSRFGVWLGNPSLGTTPPPGSDEIPVAGWKRELGVFQGSTVHKFFVRDYATQGGDPGGDKHWVFFERWVTAVTAVSDGPSH